MSPVEQPAFVVVARAPHPTSPSSTAINLEHLVALQDEVIGARHLHTHGNTREPPAKITATTLIKEQSNPPRLITGSGTADAQLMRVRAELEETSAALNAMTNKYETMRRVLISKRDIFLAQRKEVGPPKVPSFWQPTQQRS